MLCFSFTLFLFLVCACRARERERERADLMDIVDNNNNDVVSAIPIQFDSVDCYGDRGGSEKY